MVRAKILLCMCAWLSMQAKDNQFLLDTIRVVIYNDDHPIIITESDVRRPSLEGAVLTLNDKILEQLMYADALKFKINPDEEAVDRHLQAVQRDNNLTLDQLKNVFKAAGYTYEEGRKQFGIMTTVNSILDFKIRSRLIVPERDVMKYYNENPEHEEETYTLQRVVVPFSPGVSHEEQEKKLKNLSQLAVAALQWGEPFEIAKTELAEDKQFISSMIMGQVSDPVKIESGFELFRLKAKKEARLRPLQDRYRDISDRLRKPRYDQLLAEYKKELFDNASIVYFD